MAEAVILALHIMIACRVVEEHAVPLIPIVRRMVLAQSALAELIMCALTRLRMLQAAMFSHAFQKSIMLCVLPSWLLPQDDVL